MKKLIYILICLALVIACLVPVAAFASETTASVTEHDSVHFINPTAITVVGDKLYVADNIEDSKCALLCFDIANGVPALKATYELNCTVTGLSNDGAKLIYAISNSTVYAISLEDGANYQIQNTFAFSENVVGFVMGKLSEDISTEYAMTTSLLRCDHPNDTDPTYTTATVSSEPMSNPKGCVSIGDYIFYLYGGEYATAQWYKGGLRPVFSKKLTVTNPKGITAYDDCIIFYGSNSVRIVTKDVMNSWISDTTIAEVSFTTLVDLSLNDDNSSAHAIVDVAMHNEVIYILNDNMQIDLYKLGEDDKYVKDENATIGSDMVNKDVPTSYTSFTLARPNGYPANIVFKTKEASSISDIITDATEYTILGYAGDENSHYYYVMVGDKFGWVKKSNDAATPANDSKLTIVNNNVGNDTFEYETKFISLKGVYVYDLPLSTAHQTEVSQTATTMKTVTVLQEFKEKVEDVEQIWYYITYDDGKTGFVPKESVGQFHITAKVDTIETQGLKKINSSLFSAVVLYATPDLADGEAVVTENDTVLKLYSGDRVTLVETKDDVAFVMVLHNDGTKDFGWVETNRLINVHQITTNAIVGLSLLGFAIILGAVLVIVYLKRKKRIKANRD